jgi:predicted XRE-type DNA-binding protein
MIIDPNIDYGSLTAVRKVLQDINKACWENGIMKQRMAEHLNINRATFSQFIKGKKYYVTEDRIRKVIEYVNNRHFDF